MLSPKQPEAVQLKAVLGWEQQSVPYPWTKFTYFSGWKGKPAYPVSFWAKCMQMIFLLGLNPGCASKFSILEAFDNDLLLRASKSDIGVKLKPNYFALPKWKQWQNISAAFYIHLCLDLDLGLSFWPTTFVTPQRHRSSKHASFSFCCLHHYYQCSSK